MKMERFDDSIKAYQKALSMDPNFIASYIGIGKDYLYEGDTEKARTAFAKINDVARNTGERRTSHLWMAASYVHDGKINKAIEENFILHLADSVVQEPEPGHAGLGLTCLQKPFKLKQLDGGASALNLLVDLCPGGARAKVSS